MRETRRNVLRAGAGLATTGALASLAGCSQIQDIISGGGGGNAFYRNDLYEPGTVSDRNHYRFSGIRPADIDENEDEFDSDTFDSFEQYVEGLFQNHDIDLDQIQTLSSIDNGAVTIITGDYTADDVVDELEDNDFDDESETDNGYTVLLHSGQRTCTAVADEAIVTMHSERALTAGEPVVVSDEDGGTPSGMGGVDRETQDLRSMTYGETVRSQLDAEDPTGYRGYYEPISFQGTEGDVITISMASSGDTYLMLQDPSGSIVAQNDDYDGLNSQIDSFTLPSSGEYAIIATSYNSNATFTYDVSLRVAFTPDDMVSAVESVVGVKSGDTTRYVEAVDAMNDLVNAIGGGTIVSGWTSEAVETDNPEGGRIEHSVAAGYAVTVNGSESDVTAAAVFEDEGDVDAGDVEDWVSNNTTLQEADDLSENEQGRTGVVNGVIDTDEL